jgi:hypothetical protein
VLVLRDTAQHVFGAFTAEPWRIAPRYYGTGESFVFQLRVRSKALFCAACMECPCLQSCRLMCICLLRASIVFLLICEGCPCLQLTEWQWPHKLLPAAAGAAFRRAAGGLHVTPSLLFPLCNRM